MINNIDTYHANGKLLLTGEYAVLEGAKALAVPLNKGQQLRISHHSSGLLWKASNPEGLWFEAFFDNDLQLLKNSHSPFAIRLQKILQQIIKIKPEATLLLKNKTVETQLEFNPQWGWGSSSTLIALLSQWLEIDPYILLENTFGGSGYDIACALNDNPILYQINGKKPVIQPVSFNPTFKDHIYFIYSGKKQNSSNEVGRFLKDSTISNHTIEEINEITQMMSVTQNLNEFGNLMHRHAELLSNIVHLKPINTEQFNHFEGYTKALGAWGGDFFMAVSEHDKKYVQQYFKAKGLDILFKYDDIVLNSN
ncbi:GYDIA family GHMP kinase [Carboxylicivirga linearis]|uniref:GHMP kinase n=1 Tax=Carboxylicivirga linearis TaxID=1628157 RepID=A0ABS5K058_9BACT|nr:GYDIA family GHMP kinase [Carboxylicivirga linearis]MBS2100474.1 hypothetical protein [Carboxylicivirga linearis]